MARPTGRPAGRPKKQPTFEPPGFKQAVLARFIEYARRHGSAALHLLATDVWRGEMTLDAWAKSFNVAGTWVEAWAQDVREVTDIAVGVARRNTLPGTGRVRIRRSDHVVSVTRRRPHRCGRVLVPSHWHAPRTAPARHHFRWRRLCVLEPRRK